MVQTGTHGEVHSCVLGIFWDMALPSLRLLFLRWGQLSRKSAGRKILASSTQPAEEMQQGQLWGDWRWESGFRGVVRAIPAGAALG